MGCLRLTLGISWRDKVLNNTVMERAGITSVYTVLKQKRLMMEDGRIPKDLGNWKEADWETQAALQGHLQA